MIDGEKCIVTHPPSRPEPREDDAEASMQQRKWQVGPPPSLLPDTQVCRALSHSATPSRSFRLVMVTKYKSPSQSILPVRLMTSPPDRWASVSHVI